MAILYPTLAHIRKSKYQPEPGELHLLSFLEDTLPDEYEVYFQPFLNGDRPDVVVMRRGSGVLIIEVKDWHLPSYFIDENGDWRIAANYARTKSPIKQVTAYKDNLYELHIDHLLSQKINNKNCYGIVSCAVYFHCASEADVKSFCGSEDYTKLLGHDSLTASKFDDILTRLRLNKTSYYFGDDLYNSFQRYFQPPLHAMLHGIEIGYSDKQKELIESRPVEQKVRGVAGSGKTKVLAKRAVNAHSRTQERVLILTFNITLRNYIHDKISEVRENFSWDSFYIIHYHQFFAIEANNYDLTVDNPLIDCYDEMFFEDVKNKIHKYSSIFVDEVQDQETAWIRIIKKYFLKPGGEFVVFGDEKQNVFQRAMAEDKKPNTTVVGRWNELNDSSRASSRIINLAFEFQDRFFGNKYELDDINVIEQPDLFSQPQFISQLAFDKDAKANEIYSQLDFIFKILSIQPNDICIVSSKIDILREIDFLIRSQGHQRTTIAFDTKEEYASLKDLDLKALQTARKFQFWMNTGTTKLATIHSFKGWEVATLVLIIDKETSNDNFNTDELIYTAITRCRLNLIVVNLDNQKYMNFFAGYSDALPSGK